MPIPLPVSIQKPKVVAIVQARMGSSRLPGKMGMPLLGFTLLHWVLIRLAESKRIHKIVLATSTNPENDDLIRVAKDLGVDCFRGDESDVLSRFCSVSKRENAEIIVRVCADNPFIMASEVDRAIDFFISEKVDYAFNHIPKLDNEYVDGLGAEIVSAKILHSIEGLATSPDHKEHVTKWIWDHEDQYSIKTFKAPDALKGPHISLDIDTLDDFKFIESLVHKFAKSPTELDISGLLGSLRH